MNCVRCEVTRARLVATGMMLAGKTADEVASYLSGAYRVRYYVDAGVIMREGTLFPHTPIKVY